MSVDASGTSVPAHCTLTFEHEFHGEPFGIDPQFGLMNLTVCPALFRGDVATFNQARRDHPDWIPLMYRWNFCGNEGNKLDLRHVDFENVDLRGAKFSNVNLAGVSFTGSLMRACEFEFCHLRDTDFSGMDFQYGEFHWCDMERARLSRISAPVASFYDSNLAGADLRDADLSMALRFWKLDLTRADLRGAKFRADNFRDNKIDDVRIDPGQAMAILQVHHAVLARQISDFARQMKKVLSQASPQV